MENRQSIEFTLMTEHADPTGRGTAWALWCAMQAAADVNARLLGCSYEQIAPRGFYWVAARIRLDMERYPRLADTITVTTWPGTPGRLVFPRYFRFADAAGQPLGCATALYMLMDGATHAPVPPSKVDIYPQGFEVWPQENPQPEKWRINEMSAPAAFRTPVYSDIDSNRHMNNTRYVQWACDLFPTARYENAAFKKLQLNYISDGIEGHRIALALDEDTEAGRFTVRGTDQQTGKVVFEAAGEWAEGL